MARVPSLNKGSNLGKDTAGPDDPLSRLQPRWGRSVLKADSVATVKRRPDVERALVDSSKNPGLASEAMRQRMLGRLAEQGISDSRVLDAIARVPRHIFVDDALASRAYEDTALPIGFQQTLSQPYVVARSLSLALHLGPSPAGGLALEIGTGCGYQAAVMSHLFPTTMSVERIEGLHTLARRNLADLARPNLHLVLADGLEWAALNGPFDWIILAAGLTDIPQGLLRQLRYGGVLVAPVGWPEQRLVAVRRGGTEAQAHDFEREDFDTVQFVPIVKGVQR